MSETPENRTAVSPPEDLRPLLTWLQSLLASDDGGAPAFRHEQIGEGRHNVYRWLFVGHDTLDRTRVRSNDRPKPTGPSWPRTRRRNIVVRGVTVVEPGRNNSDAKRMSHTIDWLGVAAQLGMSLTRPMRLPSVDRPETPRSAT